MHSQEIGHLVNSHPSGFEIYMNKHTFGEKPWEAFYNYPDVGLSLGYYDYNNEILGESIAGLTYMDFYFNKKPAKHNLKIRIGAGVVYNTKPYDSQNNNKNNVLSTKFAGAMQTRLTYEYITNKNWKITIAPNLTHFSNGAVKKPNKGINIPTLMIGVGKLIGNPDLSFKTYNSKPEYDKGLKINVALYTGFNAISVVNEVYPFVALSSYIDKRISFQSAFNTGLDIFYSIAFREEIKNSSEYANGPKPDFTRIGWMAGYEMFVSRVSLLIQIGYYIYRPEKLSEPVYQRYGLKVYTNNRKLFFSSNLKAHLGRAEMFEFGVGARF